MEASEGPETSVLVAAAAGAGPRFSHEALLGRVSPSNGWRECGDGGWGDWAAESSSRAVGSPSIGIGLKDRGPCMKATPLSVFCFDDSALGMSRLEVKGCGGRPVGLSSSDNGVRDRGSPGGSA